MLPLLRAIQAEHSFAYDSVNRTILHDGEAISEARLKTVHLDFSAAYGINFPKTETIDGITRLALENQFDPFHEEMLRIEREVEPTDISNLSSRFLGTSDPLYDLYLEKWLVAFVGRQLNPGIYYRHMLVLQGRQNIGKDAMGRILSGKGNWTTVGSRADFDNRDLLISAHSKNLLNFDELERTTKNVVEGSLKSFLSNSDDSFVNKYSNQCQTYPRRFSCWGSCNQGQFLTDLTGNSRFHVIPIPFNRVKDEMIDLKCFESERDQILAGAIKLYRMSINGSYSLELTTEQLRRSEELNQAFVSEAPFVQQLESLLDGRTTVTITTVHGMLDLDNRSQIDTRTQRAVKDSLSQIGFACRSSPIRVKLSSGKPTSMRVWVRQGCSHDSSR
jgi:predicted P-loop ATPase